MNTIQIESLLKNIRYFRGVHAADKLPTLISEIHKKHRNQPACFISNTQPSHEPGEHWVAFYIPRGQGSIEFFDSFGFHNKKSFLQTMYFRDFIEKLKNEVGKSVIKLKANIYRIQDEHSTLCGQYCCVYLVFRCQKKKSMKKILELMNKNQYIRNDLNVLQLFKKHVAKCKKVNNNICRVKNGIQECQSLKKICDSFYPE